MLKKLIFSSKFSKFKTPLRKVKWANLNQLFQVVRLDLNVELIEQGSTLGQIQPARAVLIRLSELIFQPTVQHEKKNNQSPIIIKIMNWNLKKKSWVMFFRFLKRFFEFSAQFLKDISAFFFYQFIFNFWKQFTFRAASRCRWRARSRRFWSGRRSIGRPLVGFRPPDCIPYRWSRAWGNSLSAPPGDSTWPRRGHWQQRPRHCGPRLWLRIALGATRSLGWCSASSLRQVHWYKKKNDMVTNEILNV